MPTSPGIRVRCRLGEASYDWVGALCWSPDGQTLAAVDLEKKTTLWNINDLSKKELKNEYDSTCLEWIDNEVLALAPIYVIELWSKASGKRTVELKGHDSSVWGLAWSSHRRLLASASGDQTVRLWHRDSQTSVGKLTGHRGDVMCVCWMDEILLSGGEDGTIRSWAGPLGTEARIFTTPGKIVNCLAWSPATSRLASCGIHSDEITIWDSRGSRLQRLRGHTSGVTWAGFSPDGRVLASTSWDGTLRLWRCDSWKTVAVLDARNSENHFTKLAFNPHLPLLATLDEEGSVIVLWELEIEALVGAKPASWLSSLLKPSTPGLGGASSLEHPSAGARQHPAEQFTDQAPGQPTAEAAPAEAASTRRAAFDAAMVQLRSLTAAQSTPRRVPSCFISYAWGVPAHEAWVEKRLATDLRQAGIDVILDRWENMAIGSNVARFLSRIAASDNVLVVGSPLYGEKCENRRPDTGFIASAEVDLITQRLLGTEAAKSSVLPVLLAADETSSLPPLLRGRVWGDFRRDEAYFSTLFDLILTLFGLPFSHPTVARLRDSLQHRRP